MLHRLEGIGLPNVFLSSGHTLEGEGDAQTIAYSDIDELYEAIATAIARRASPLSAGELRFLRKRLGWSQHHLGALTGKTSQAVAKWEKELTNVPLAEAHLIRLVWLQQHVSRRALAEAVERMARGYSESACGYVMAYGDGRWKEDERAEREHAEREASAALATVLDSVMTKYTGGKGEHAFPSKLDPTDRGMT